MGKTPKKAVPGGDERNLYVRRLKASNAPSKTSETNLPERQRDSESTSRPKLTGIQRRISQGPGKAFKSKLRSPVKLGLSNPPKRLSKPLATTNQERDSTESAKNTQTIMLNVQPEAERAAGKHDVSVPKENVKEENVNTKKKDDEEVVNDKQGEQCENKEQKDVVSGKEVESKPSENLEVMSAEKQIEIQEKDNYASQNSSKEGKEIEEQEDSDIKLSYDADDSPVKLQEEKSNYKELSDEEKLEEMHKLIQKETKNVIDEKEDLQSDQQTDTESYSVDILESTTSEVSETSETVSQNETQKEKEKHIQTTNNDGSCVSYDASIMLKDVQIKLNDCVKDNSKLFDENIAEHSTPNHPTKDMSFGKTLRSISGRHSINRMRHVTGREYRLSPNNSLFVNTSTMSQPQDEIADYKILRYSSGISEATPTNGSSLDRKRRFETEGWSSAKKQKTESENSLLNTSIGLLKGLRKPIQVTSPNVGGYRFQSDKLHISGIRNDEDKVLVEQAEGVRKWCIIM